MVETPDRVDEDRLIRVSFMSLARVIRLRDVVAAVYIVDCSTEHNRAEVPPGDTENGELTIMVLAVKFFSSVSLLINQNSRFLGSIVLLAGLIP